MRRKADVAVLPVRRVRPRVRTALFSLTAIVLLSAAPGAGTAMADDPTAASGSAVTASMEETLRDGDRGRAVRRLQRRLGIPADGVFGPQTDRAVKREKLSESEQAELDRAQGISPWPACGAQATS